MACEQHTQPVGADFTGTHQCTRAAAWVVTTPEGETLRLCTQHLRQLERVRYGQALQVERLRPVAVAEPWAGWDRWDGLDPDDRY